MPRRPSSQPPSPASATAADESGALRAEIARLSRALAAAEARASAFEALAHEDALTGVLNRRGFEREILRAIAFTARYGTAAAVLAGDLDGFKAINDRHGHPAGDAALRHAASLLARTIRASDAIGRIGGDEFGIVLWQVDDAAAAAKAQALMGLLAAEPLIVDGAAIPLSLSLGAAAIRPQDGVGEVMARADAALYEVKRARRRGALTR